MFAVSAALITWLFRTIGFEQIKVALIKTDMHLIAISAYSAFVSIIIFVAQTPVTIADFGVRESSYVLLFGLIGVDEGQAFTLSILSFSLIALTVLAGGLGYLIQSRRYRRFPGSDSSEIRLHVTDEQ